METSSKKEAKAEIVAEELVHLSPNLNLSPNSTQGNPTPSKTCMDKIGFLGECLMAFGLFEAFYFYTAPVLIPISAGLLVVSGFMFPIFYCCRGSKRDASDPVEIRHMVNILTFAIVFGLTAAFFTGYYAWIPIVTFVYNSKNMVIAGATGVAISFLGAFLNIFATCMFYWKTR